MFSLSGRWGWDTPEGLRAVHAYAQSHGIPIVALAEIPLTKADAARLQALRPTACFARPFGFEELRGWAKEIERRWLGHRMPQTSDTSAVR